MYRRFFFIKTWLRYIINTKESIKTTIFNFQGELDSPGSFVTELRNADLKGEKRLKVLESLRVSLTSNPVR